MGELHPTVVDTLEPLALDASLAGLECLRSYFLSALLLRSLLPTEWIRVICVFDELFDGGALGFFLLFGHGRCADSEEGAGGQQA